MAPIHLQLDVATLEGLTARVRAQHGPSARIVSADKVRVGGYRGFFAREHYAVTVELPDPPQRGVYDSFDLPTRMGIAALLEDADQAETQIHAAGSRRPLVSTESESFAALMDDFTFNTPAPRAPVAGSDMSSVGPRPVSAFSPSAESPRLVEPPKLYRRPGDLVLVLGSGDDGFLVARTMAAATDAPVLSVGGALLGADRVEDRRSALAARARGVESGHPAFVAFGLGRGGREAATQLSSVDAIAADQVWIAVDAGRKPGDTARWVDAVRDVTPIHGVAVVGADLTESPETVLALNLPVGWADGRAVVGGTWRP